MPVEFASNMRLSDMGLYLGNESNATAGPLKHLPGLGVVRSGLGTGTMPVVLARPATNSASYVTIASMPSATLSCLQPLGARSKRGKRRLKQRLISVAIAGAPIAPGTIIRGPQTGAATPLAPAGGHLATLALTDPGAAVLALVRAHPGLDYLGIARALNLRLKATAEVVQRLIEAGEIVAPLPEAK